MPRPSSAASCAWSRTLASLHNLSTGHLTKAKAQRPAPSSDSHAVDVLSEVRRWDGTVRGARTIVHTETMSPTKLTSKVAPPPRTRKELCSHFAHNFSLKRIVLDSGPHNLISGLIVGFGDYRGGLQEAANRGQATPRAPSAEATPVHSAIILSIRASC